MGSRIARKLSREGHTVLVWNRSPEPASDLIREAPQIKAYPSVEALLVGLSKPRIVWLMLPAGDPTESVLTEVLKLVAKDDIVVDGGNSNFKDTQRRYEELKSRGVRFLGIGVSGGVLAEENGYPQMVGGDKSAYEHIAPILDSLAKPNGGHQYFGEGGAGHFVKMVHNGIEYGTMQSLGEGFEVLSKSPYSLDLLSVAKLWQKGTLVSGFMLDRAVDVLTSDPTLEDVVGSIAQSGEAKWTVEQAKEEGVNVEIIERSLEYRKRSQADPKIQESFTAKLVASLRNAFGGHEVKKQ
ncbi:NADP-dependent phosphogluconate dehydrogenase [Candidatus Gottesmanbacteria bacterium]|nr:NADP-dependent phosphogluconate dehydrogenase [Candidatus Gottesmanbacteria bacterium]